MKHKNQIQRKRPQVIALLASLALIISASVLLAPSASSAGPVGNSFLPYASDSVWRRPVDTIRQWESASDPMTSEMRGRGVTTWMNIEQYSHPVVYASASDPFVTVTDTTHGGDPNWLAPKLAQFQVPRASIPAAGTDGHLHIVQPDGQTIWETFRFTWTGATTANVSRMHTNDLINGSGIGPMAGTRAYGGSAIGGLIRASDVDPSHPGYTDGVIRHPLAIALPSSWLKYTGGQSGYDSNGFGTALGYVWPATEQDWGSPTGYRGDIPMGTFFAIPKSVDINSLGLSAEALPIAKALQDYGAYIVDTVGGSGTVAFYAEPDVPSSWASNVRSSSYLEKMRLQLVASITTTLPTLPPTTTTTIIDPTTTTTVVQTTTTTAVPPTTTTTVVPPTTTTTVAPPPTTHPRQKHCDRKPWGKWC